MFATSGNSMIFTSSAKIGPRQASRSKNRYAEKLLISKRFQIRREKSIWIHADNVADPNFFHPGSEFFSSRIRILSIPDPGFASKNLSILTNKLFLSSRKYNPCCSSRIRISDPDFLPIPDSGVKKVPDPGSPRLHADSDPGLP